jgi:hypothetical protein
MAIQVRKATKSRVKARIALVGPPGSGKTYTALSAAFALGKKVAVINTERGGPELYADTFPEFDIVDLTTFAPKTYIEAIRELEKLGYDVIVIDSLSHAWAGKDGVLEMVDNLKARSQSKNSFSSWREATPEQNALVDALLQSTAHIIATMRVKTEWVVEEDERGKKVPRKVGLQPVQRDQIEYEFDVVGDMNTEHVLVISKSRINVIADAVVRKPDSAWFQQVADWLADGVPFAATAETPAPRSSTSPQPSAPAATAPKPNAPAAAQTAPDGKITNEQRRVMWDHAQALGLDVNGLAKEANTILGTSYNSPAEMTTDEANRVILELERRQTNAQQQAAS